MKLVIFDCDGTLVDSQNGIVAAMDYAFGALKLVPPPRAKTLTVVGLSLPEAFEILAPQQDAATRAKLADKYKNAFLDLKRDPALHEPLFPGAREQITALSERDDIVLGIATGKSRRGVDRLFEREGWAPHFTTIQTADGHPSKPHPSMILTAMREAGIGPQATIMVGDTTYDMEMASAAGVAALGVGWGYHPGEALTSAGAQTVIEDYSGLQAALDSLASRRETAA